MILIPDDTRPHPQRTPANMVLAPLPADPYPLRVFLPRRYCERISTIIAPCEPISFPLPLSFLLICPLPSIRPSSSATSSCVPHLLLSFKLLTASEKANLLGSGIGLYVAYHLEKYYRRRREVRAHPSSPRPKLTPSQKSLRGRSRGCIDPFPRPTRPLLSTLTRRTSPVHNFSLFTTNPTHHRPRCSRRTMATKRAKHALALRAWRWPTSGTNERSYSVWAMPTKVMTKIRAMARATPRSARRPLHHQSGQMRHEIRNRQSR